MRSTRPRPPARLEEVYFSRVQMLVHKCERSKATRPLARLQSNKQQWRLSGSENDSTATKSAKWRFHVLRVALRCAAAVRELRFTMA